MYIDIDQNKEAWFDVLCEQFEADGWLPSLAETLARKHFDHFYQNDVPQGDHEND